MRVTIGRQVQRLRTQRGFTLQQLGEAAGLSAAFLANVEREVSSLSGSSLASIAKALDASPSFFFDRPEPNGVAVRGYARAPFRMEHAEVVNFGVVPLMFAFGAIMVSKVVAVLG